jgi:hypothetical protein
LGALLLVVLAAVRHAGAVQLLEDSLQPVELVLVEPARRDGGVSMSRCERQRRRDFARPLLRFVM